MSADLRARDTESRRLAQTELERPLLLEAGAGTGKTAVLVARVVAWCLGPGWEKAAARRAASASAAVPEAIAAETLARVAAITFTEAASAEMASRVGDALLHVRRGELPAGVLDDALPRPREERERRAVALVGVLDQLQVSTIHAFCRRLLATHPLEAGLHPDFQVDADGRRLAEAVRDVLEARLESAYVDPGDEDFLALADRGVGPAALEAAMAALIEEGGRAEDLAEVRIGDAASERFARGLARAVSRFLEIERGRLEALGRGAPTLSAAVASLRELRGHLEAVSEWSGPMLTSVAGMLGEEAGGKLVEKLGELARERFGSRAGKALGDDAEALATAAAEIRPLLRHLLAFDFELLAALRRVVAGLMAEAEARLRAEGAITFGGLLRGARDLLIRHPEVAARERRSIDQLLVDEFQDTDSLQCEVLEALALQGPASERPGLFLVGDPKQSIYGFRHADLRAYEAFRRRVVEANPLGVRPLAVNFRSAPPILQEVHRLVAPVMREEPGLQPAFEDLLASEANAARQGFGGPGFATLERWLTGERSPENGMVDLEPLARRAAELEALAVAADVQRLRRERDVSYGAVALLLRNRSDAEIYLEQLRSAGIPFVMEREPERHRRREVIEATALLRCILDPLDGVALVASLRSAAVGVPDAALIPLWERGFPDRMASLHARRPEAREALHRIVAEVARALPAGVPGLKRLGRWEEGLLDFLDAVGDLRELFETASPERFVEALRGRILFEASQAARSLGSWRVATLDGFFRDLVQALEEQGGSSSAVLAHLRRVRSSDQEHREGRARPLVSDAVHVGTIHGAKGLEFDHVYLLQTHHGQRAGNATAQTRIIRRGDRLEYVLLGNGTPGLPELAADREAVEARERVRLLYVAATRARERLVVLGVWPGRVGRALEEARSHADLLAHREETEDIQAKLDDLAQGEGYHDGSGVRWRLAGAIGLPAAPREEPGGPRLEAAVERARRDETELRERCERASARESRPFSTAASEAEQELELRGPSEETEGGGAVGRAAGDESDPARRLALAAGTAVHAGLECLDLATDDPSLWREPFLRGAEACLAVAAGHLDAAAVRKRVEEIWRRLEGGPLLEHLRRIAAGVVARELPVLLNPCEGPSEAVGFVSGAIDLLYRDPEDGALVVADYKTDAVEAGPELEARKAAYAPQGRVYTRAVKRALDLPEEPRFELWFLHPGVRV